MSQQKLSYVSDDVLYQEVRKVLDIAQLAVDKAEVKLYKNVIDPFSALFDTLRQGISLGEWLGQEKARQIQKTMQNAVGDFHQAILGSVEGWENLRVGKVADLRSNSNKIVAEVKNKHNTTKGNHRKVIYDDLYMLVTSVYPGFTGYYVEIVPKSKKPYNKPFTPSDNETGLRRPENDQVRIIDGRSFYALVTGNNNALDDLYSALPIVVAEILGKDPEVVINDPIYTVLFKRAYPDII